MFMLQTTCCLLVVVGIVNSIKAVSGKDVPPVEILAPTILTTSFVSTIIPLTCI